MIQRTSEPTTDKSGLHLRIGASGSLDLGLRYSDSIKIRAEAEGVSFDRICALDEIVFSCADGADLVLASFDFGHNDRLSMPMDKVAVATIQGYLAGIRAPSRDIAPRIDVQADDASHTPRDRPQAIAPASSQVAPKTGRRRFGKLGACLVVLLIAILGFEITWSLSGQAHEQAARSWIQAHHPLLEERIFGGRSRGVSAAQVPPSSPATIGQPTSGPARFQQDAAALYRPAGEPMSPQPATGSPAPGSPWSRPLVRGN